MQSIYSINSMNDEKVYTLLLMQLFGIDNTGQSLKKKAVELVQLSSYSL